MKNKTSNMELEPFISGVVENIADNLFRRWRDWVLKSVIFEDSKGFANSFVHHWNFMKDSGVKFDYVAFVVGHPVMSFVSPAIKKGDKFFLVATNPHASDDIIRLKRDMIKEDVDFEDLDYLISIIIDGTSEEYESYKEYFEDVSSPLASLAFNTDGPIERWTEDYIEFVPCEYLNSVYSGYGYETISYWNTDALDLWGDDTKFILSIPVSILVVDWKTAKQLIEAKDVWLNNIARLT